jgi:hypothetical protein
MMRKLISQLFCAGFLLTASHLCAQNGTEKKTVPTGAAVSDSSDFAAPKDPATEDQIREYLSLINTNKLAHEMMNKMADSMQATAAPYYPKSFWDDIRAEFAKFDLITPYVTVYQRYLSREDIQAAIDFYRSSAGKKLLIAQPFAIRDVQVMVGQTAQQIGEKVYERHAAEIEEAKAKFEADAAANAAKK